MNKNSKKSVKDFNGQSISASQQQAIKGGNVSDGQATDWIIMDDILDY